MIAAGLDSPLKDSEQTMLQLNRRSLGAAFAAFVALGAAASSHAQGVRDPGAERFVQTGAQAVLSILADRGQSETQKEVAFRRAINELADVPKITNFVLGKYGRTITPAQRAQFATAFRAYAERVYRNRLDDYHGETVRVTGSSVRKPGDVIVNTEVSGGQLKQPVLVSWRVLGAGGVWKVVDVQFKGIWLAITQQQDIVSTIDNAHGDIGVLIDRLNRDAQIPLAR
jgi:phospholipid transport system substrate-binding protein